LNLKAQRFDAHAEGTDWSVRTDHAVELAMNQVVCKVAPALAAGCTMVLKPSEIAPLSAYLFAQIMDEAGVRRAFSIW